MSASAFVGPFGKKARRERRADAPTSSGPSDDASGEIYRRHRGSEWIGEQGAHVRLRVRVEGLHEASDRTITLLARVETSGDLVEWSMARRHRIRVGDRLALSGLVKAHLTRHDTRVTVLRDCFNPLRMT